MRRLGMLKNQLTFNDGIAEIRKPGSFLNRESVPKNCVKVNFEYRTVGFNRYFEGLQNQIEISKMILIPRGAPVMPQDVVTLTGDAGRYIIRQAQEKRDTLPPSVQLSLQRITVNCDTEITLVKVIKTTYDNNGNPVDETMESKVRAMVKSIEQKEFFACAQTGLKPFMAFTVLTSDYNGETKVISENGEKLNIYRTFTDGAWTEIYCTAEVGA